MKKIRGSSQGVWPGYVAAVSSLVLSLLLLAGIMGVAISQVGRVLDTYNRQLIAEVIMDEQRDQELTKLFRTANHAVARPAPSMDLSEAQRLLGQIVQDRDSQLAKAQNELQRLQAERKQEGDNAAQTEKRYRLVFASGSEGLDPTMLGQLQAQLQRDGLLTGKNNWQLESGTKTVDGVAEREIYRLMLNVRAQLQNIGIAGNQVQVLTNRDRTPQEMLGPKSQQQRGDITMILRRDLQKAGT